MTKIVIFIDGTDNNGELDSLKSTNVHKMYSLAKLREKADSKLKAMYIPGIGTGYQPTRNPLRFLQKRLDLVFGGGASKRIKDAYLFLAQNYQQDDHVFLFGFSRGAFIARMLAGFIHKVGLLLAPYANQHYVEYAFYLYWVDSEGYRFHSFLRKMQARAQQAGEILSVPTHFLGQWDTVAAIDHAGITVPQEEALSEIRQREQHQPLPDWIQHCRHAVSIHELRPTFEPLLWSTLKDGKKQTLKQVWFAGAHADVGGGYETTPSPLPAGGYAPRTRTGTMFSDICLYWMIEEANCYGLGLEQHSVQSYIPGSWPHQESRGKLPLQSFTIRRQLRDAGQRDLRFEFMHHSARERMWELPPQCSSDDGKEEVQLLAIRSMADEAAMRLHYLHCFPNQHVTTALSPTQLQTNFDGFCMSLLTGDGLTPAVTEAAMRLAIAFGDDTAWRKVPTRPKILDKRGLQAIYEMLHHEVNGPGIDGELKSQQEKILLHFYLLIALPNKR